MTQTLSLRQKFRRILADHNINVAPEHIVDDGAGLKLRLDNIALPACVMAGVNRDLRNSGARLELDDGDEKLRVRAIWPSQFNEVAVALRPMMESYAVAVADMTTDEVLSTVVVSQPTPVGGAA